ncbi:MAG: response regulator transcription factor [Clostridia bacterium]|nr:response regulator transcription factor [Clostridia bacterium]
MKILLAEDEKRMNMALTEILRQEKYEVDSVFDGGAAEDAIETGIYDLIILDVMMPVKNGFSVLKSARGKGIKTPILMLTAKSAVEDKVEGLDGGADDYLTKPFLTKELLARIRALTRRTTGESDGLMRYGDLTLNVKDVTLTSATTGQSVRLSEKEFRIMEYMMANKGQVLSREQIAVKIWGYDSEAEYNNVEVYMTFTRKKLAFIGATTKIKAIRGIGYQLREEDV